MLSSKRGVGGCWEIKTWKEIHHPECRNAKDFVMGNGQGTIYSNWRWSRTRKICRTPKYSVDTFLPLRYVEWSFENSLMCHFRNTSRILNWCMGPHRNLQNKKNTQIEPEKTKKISNIIMSTCIACIEEFHSGPVQRHSTQHSIKLWITSQWTLWQWSFPLSVTKMRLSLTTLATSLFFETNPSDFLLIACKPISSTN